MNERRQQTILEYLQHDDAQARILGHMQQARSNLAVTISIAARLFNFSESQLREWERRGLLRTTRPMLSGEGKGSTGHRQYSAGELFKLAIMRDLLDQGYTPGEIPVNIDKVWEDAAGVSPESIGMFVQPAEAPRRSQRLSINARVEHADAQAFWRYFVAQSLRLSLLLLCEDVPDTVAGLILPLEEHNLAGLLAGPADLGRVGRSLVGWLDRNRSFHLFLTDEALFDFPTDYRLQTLKLGDEQMPGGDRVLDNVWIVLERDTERLAFARDVQEVVQRLLALVYARVNDWEAALVDGERAGLYQAHDLQRVSRVGGDRIFNALLEQILDLGGQTDTGEKRWRFCSLLLPDDASVPVQQQNLVVLAQAGYSPYQLGLTTISPSRSDQINHPCFHAFASTQIVLQPTALPEDSLIQSARVQVITRGTQVSAPPVGEKLHSALSVPLVDEDGFPLGVLYCEANEARAFAERDLRIFRLMARMLEELLQTSRSRSRRIESRANMLAYPARVGEIFNEFRSETEFIAEIDSFLGEIQSNGVVEARAEEEFSLVSVGLDHQSDIALKYGPDVARSIGHEVGQRIQRRLGMAGSLKLFHVSADTYYVVLADTAIDDARKLAKQLQDALRGNYRVSQSGKPVAQENMLEVIGVTAHLAISSYPLEKLNSVLHRYPDETAVTYVRRLIQAGIEEMLELGRREGGDCIVSWDRGLWGYDVLQ